MSAVYKEAGIIVDRALRKEGSVKNLCLSSLNKNKRKLYALVCETLKRKHSLCRGHGRSGLHVQVAQKLISEMTKIFFFVFLFLFR